MLHWTAWEKGVKSLYYCRSQSVQRTAYAGGKGDAPDAGKAQAEGFTIEKTDYDECLACQ